MITIALAASPDARVAVEIVDGAAICAVHLHGDEADARAAFRQLGCANRLDLPTRDGKDRSTRRFSLGTCAVDPNRIFTSAGRDAQLAGCREPDARAALDAFAADLLAGLDRCRAGGLPVVAFHNNSAFTVHTFDDVAAASRAVPGQRAQDLLLVTSRADFDALGSRSAVLQSPDAKDDGSLSVLLARDRYVNIETRQGGGPEAAASIARDVLGVMAPGRCSAR